MRKELIKLGFEELPHKTLGNFLIYKIISKHNKTRIISIGFLQTPNEIVSIGELKSNNLDYEDLTVISNFDYDGYITLERIVFLLKGLDKNFKN